MLQCDVAVNTKSHCVAVWSLCCIVISLRCTMVIVLQCGVVVSTKSECVAI